MKVLAVHNYYQQAGGEDVVFHAEAEMLRDHGQEIVTYTRKNDEIDRLDPFGKAALPLKTIWARDSYQQIKQIIANDPPDIAHFHNTFPLISPAAYYACRRANIPVVQTLHNSRLLCPAATLFRDGHACEECVGKAVPWPALLHGCYRGSRIQTGVVAAMLATHRARGTWKNDISAFICSTELYRKKFIAGGLPAEKVFCKPHFVPSDPGSRQGDGNYALFIGRLAAEKGVETLITAWKRPLRRRIKIRGDGPLLPEVQRLRNYSCGAVDLVPRLDRSDLFALIKGARFLVWPSLGYYESFGLVAIEALACGVPVLASRIGVMQEIIQDRHTGLHFTAGDSGDLAAKVEWAWIHPSEMQEMGRNARAEYEAKYTAERNYHQLMEIYERVISAARAQPRRIQLKAGGQDAIQSGSEARFS